MTKSVQCLAPTDTQANATTEMSGAPNCGSGNGHKHGCLDALAISLSSVSMYKHLDFQLVMDRLKEAGLYSAENLAMAGCGNILPESVIGHLLPADADGASREALNVIFDVSRQALPGSMRLCLRQLRYKQGVCEVQTGMASSSSPYPVDLCNTLAIQASRLQNRLSRSLVGSKGQVFHNAHHVDFSLQSKESSEFTWAVERCFLFLEELGTHCPRYNLCFSAPFPARETNRQLQAGAFQSSFSGSVGISQMRRCTEIYFSQFKSLGWDPWFPTKWRVAAFLQDSRVKRTTHANRMLRALEWIQACFGVETHFSAVFVRSQVSGRCPAGERPSPKQARMATVEMLAYFEEVVFSALSSILSSDWRIWSRLGVEVA